MTETETELISPERLAWFDQRATALRANIGQAVRGKPEVIRLTLTCLLAEGHLLVEDVPGVGKTSLARALAASIDGDWHRIQFTPDLLPSDVTGVTIYHQTRQAFEFHPGPVVTNIVGGDEINRASPRTQSALLEVMDERRVTVDGRPHPVPRPFMVIATQNPVEMEGTYRLPEAQLDRFLLRTEVGYPDHDAEVEILTSQSAGSVVDGLAPVVSQADVAAMIAAAATVHVDAGIRSYIVRLAQALRDSDEVLLAVSPRATLALMRAARVWAALEGRGFVVPEDVKGLAAPVWSHRMILSGEAMRRNRSCAEVVADALATTDLPADRATDPSAGERVG
ncbi:MAG TPA: MoxR family ATPase [Acidimicrobiales bacterium]